MLKTHFAPLLKLSIATLVITAQPVMANTWLDLDEDEGYTPRHESSFVQAGDRFYSFGGRESAQTLDTYDYANDTWSTSASAPFEFNHFQATEYEGHVWVIGAFKDNGFPRESPADHIFTFDPANNTWLQGREIPEERRRGSAGLVEYQGKFYVVGGNTIGHRGGFVSWFDEYDPETGEWTALEDAPSARDHFSAAVVDDKLYLAGGRLTGGDGGIFEPRVATVDVYDFASGSWSTLPSDSNIPTPRAGTSTVAFQGNVLVIGGEGGGQAFDTVEQLDPTTNTWTEIAPMNNARHGTQAIVSGDGIFTLGGSPNQGGGSQHNLEAFNSSQAVGEANTPALLTAAEEVVIPLNNIGSVEISHVNGNQGALITAIELINNASGSFELVEQTTLPVLVLADGSRSVQVRDTSGNIGEQANLLITYDDGKSVTVPVRTPFETAVTDWIDIAPLNKLRFESSATQYDGDLYIFNGFRNRLRLEQTVERLDGDTLTWDIISDTSLPLATAVTHNGLVRDGADVWIIGGRFANTLTVVDTVRIFNIDSNLWRMGPSLPVAGGAGGAAIVDDQIHWIGGTDENFGCDVPNHFVYDLNDTDAGWQDITDVAPMPSPRNHFSTAVLDGIIYTIGGQFGHQACADLAQSTIDTGLVHAYDPVAMTWTQLASLPAANSHNEAGTFAYEGAIYSIGGEQAGQGVLRYNPNINVWETVAVLPEALNAPVATVLNGRLIVASGGAPDFRSPTDRARYTDIAPLLLPRTTPPVVTPVTGQCSATSNIADSGTATQSTVFRDDRFPASNAIDGDLTNFTHTASDNSANASPNTWTLTFDENNLINEIELFNRWNCCGERLRDITVTVLTESGEVAYSSELLNAENVLGTPDSIVVTLPTPVSGRSIHVTRTPDLSGSSGNQDLSTLSLAEVNVEGCAEDTVGTTPTPTPTPLTCDIVDNLALSGEASQSSNFSRNRFPASLAIDGNFGNFTHTSRSDNEASLSVELQGESILNEIVLYNRPDNANNSRLRDIIVTVQNESGNVVYSSDLLNPENELGSPAQINVSLPADTIGSSVSIQRISDPDFSGTNGAGNADEPNVLSLGELEIFGCSAPAF